MTLVLGRRRVLGDFTGLRDFFKSRCGPCECTYNKSKEKYACTIFAVLITLYLNSQLNIFHELMVTTIIVFMNTLEKFLERKTVSKRAP